MRASPFRVMFDLRCRAAAAILGILEENMCSEPHLVTAMIFFFFLRLCSVFQIFFVVSYHTVCRDSGICWLLGVVQSCLKICSCCELKKQTMFPFCLD